MLGEFSNLSADQLQRESSNREGAADHQRSACSVAREQDFEVRLRCRSLYRAVDLIGRYLLIFVRNRFFAHIDETDTIRTSGEDGVVGRHAALSKLTPEEVEI